MIFLKSNEFNALKETKYSSRLRICGDQLYKKCSISDRYFMEKLLKVPKTDGLLLPNDIIYITDTSEDGYSQDYIPDAINGEEFLSTPFNIDILRVIHQLFELLTSAHEHFILGDVYNRNILIDNSGKAYLCDFDSGALQNDYPDLNLVCYYRVDLKNEPISDSNLSDTIKMLISCLCLYYGVNIEEYFRGKSNTINIADVLELLKEIKANPYIINYIRSLVNDLISGRKDASENFSDIIPLISLPSEKEKERLVRTLYL